MNVCLLLASGSSERFGGEIPKQYLLLNGVEVIAYSIEAMKNSKSSDATICVANPEYVQRIYERYGIETVAGGESRNESLRNGLEYIKRRYPQCEKLFINEAARPFLMSDIVDDYFNKLDEYDGVITSQKITDSLGKYGEGATDRAEYYLIQAPEAFRFELLYKYFKADSPITATAQQLPSDTTVFHNFDFRHNLKITYPEDLVIAQALMRYIHDKDDRS